MSRHYEEEPPFKWTFEFYQQNRLRKALESDLRRKIEVSDQEIEAYYAKEKAKFGRAEMATLDVIIADNELIEKMWSGILLGSRFAEQLKKYSKEAERLADVDVEKLSPEVWKAIERLEDGEISAPFEFNGETALVKLWARKPGASPQLEQVRGKIIDEIKSLRFKKVKEDYLKELRARSIIKVDEKTWKKIKKEFETKSNEKS
jgi:parvulin-like peptidyl-prolyl isomerase